MLLQVAGRARLRAERTADFELYREAVAAGYAEAMVRAGAWKRKGGKANRVKAQTFDEIDAWVDRIGAMHPGRVN